MKVTREIVAAGLLGTIVLWANPAAAQLDPLLFLKTTAPNVVVVVDTANRMQRDADNIYYDPGEYTATGADYELTMGLSSSDYGATTKKYRRTYPNLAFLTPNANNDKFSADSIVAVGDNEPGYARFYDRTRLAVARKSLIEAITDNSTSARFSLIKTRQSSPTLPSAGNDGPVLFTSGDFGSTGDQSAGKWKITRTTTTPASATNTETAPTLPLVKADDTNANAAVLAKLRLNHWQTGALLAAGADASNQVDAPVGNMLIDAKTEATRLITADTALAASQCRNTVVVLVVGGGEGTINPKDLGAVAAGFRNISSRRVPIYVIALAPKAAEVAKLEEVATSSGGQYFEISKSDIESVAAGQPVPAFVRAVNVAVSHAFATPTDFNAAPTAANPHGPNSEFETTSPIVGTVNLKGAQMINADGSLGTLPDNETEVFNNGTVIPQRSNVLVTSALVLPGFGGTLRGFRVYKPRLPLSGESTPPSGYVFAQDGTRLWVSSIPSESSRNVFTVLPDGSIVPFTTANENTLDNYLRLSDATSLITWIRSQPLGAIVGSTPAVLDAPSLDPPPDEDYPGFREDNADRRTLVFVGANDGMLHAFDARTGLEVWAFIPFNLLPKLSALRNGQSIDAFKYFVDSSPKVSDVKVGGKWKTYLFFGQGPGGTFYNALDVTLDGMAGTLSQTDDSPSALLSYFSNASRITWEWSFPRNSVFNHTLNPYGDVSSAASAVEKSVGETWSDPAIGQLHDEDGPFVMLTGSGFLPYTTEQRANRGGVKAGTTFYVLDVETGAVHASRNVGDDGFAEKVDNCKTAGDCTQIKNALQMDPVATGPTSSRFVSKAYIGDLDGKVWRFDISLNSSTNTGTLSSPVSLYSAGRAYPLFSSMATVTVGGTLQYIFVGTGSDALPSTGVNQSYSMLVLLDNGNSASKTAEVLLEKTDGIGDDEKITSFPAVAGDIVFFTTTSYKPTTPCTPYAANLYATTFIGGPAYDTNNDGVLTAPTSGGGGKGGGTTGAAVDSTKIFAASGTRATAPFIVDQHLVFSVNGKIQMFGDPKDFNNGVGQAGVRVLSWRTIR